MADAPVQRHDGGDHTVYLLRALGLRGFDVFGRVPVHHHVARHPAHDRVAAMDDAPLHGSCW